MTTQNEPLGTGSLIVSPTYNERENLEIFLSRIFEFAPGAHVLIVDDNSPDGTGQLADDFAAKDPRVKVMHRAGKLGLGSAYREAFGQGLLDPQYAYFFQMDADLSHDAKYLPTFVEALDHGADEVIGSRNIPGGAVEGWGAGRHFMSKGGSLYSRIILGLATRDLTSGYKAYRREALVKMDISTLLSEGYSYQIETSYRLAQRGCKIVEVPITFVDRRAGASKMSQKIFVEASLVVWKLRWKAMRGVL
jgi:dolichol-phosphate mannosyltransferase